jgi:hypothetical protein
MRIRLAARVAVIVAILPLALALGACTFTVIRVQESTALPEPTRAGATVDDGSETSAKVGAAYTTRDTIEPVVSARSGVSMPWKVISSSPQSRLITIVYASGGGSAECGGEHSGVSVAESSDSVTVMAVSRVAKLDTTGVVPTGCSAVLMLGAGTIRLRAPLGTRTLYHAAVPDAQKNLLP